MNRIAFQEWLGLGIVILLVSGCATRGQTEAVPETAGAQEAHIAIVAVGEIDDAHMQRIVSNLVVRLTPDIKVLPARKPVGGTSFEEEAKALASIKPDKAIAVVGLAVMNEDVEKHGMVFMEKDGPEFNEMPVGIVNATALQGDDPEAMAYIKRLEKEALRVGALLTGMQPCPLFLCALFHYQTYVQLDNKGPGLCPPCMRKYDALAPQKNMKSADKPFGGP